MQTFIAFASSIKLDDTTQTFIDNMAHDPQQTDPKSMASIMTDFTREALSSFFLVPAEQLKLQGAKMSVIKTTVSSISSATNLLIKRTAPKLDLAENKAMAHYMDVLRIRPEDASGNPKWHVAFPLTQALAEQARLGLSQLDEGNIETARSTLTEYLLGLTDEALHWYFEQPLELLHLGPILSRLANASRTTTRKGAKLIIRKVFVKLEGADLVAMGDYIRAQLIDIEPRLDEQRPR